MSPTRRPSVSLSSWGILRRARPPRLGFDKAFVRRMLQAQGDSDAPPTAGDFHVPSRISLARTLLESWLEEEE